jgi:hypothetical protein
LTWLILKIYQKIVLESYFSWKCMKKEYGIYMKFKKDIKPSSFIISWKGSTRKV